MSVTGEITNVRAGTSAGPSGSVDDRPRGGVLVAVVAVLSGVFMAGAGVWALASPRDFAEFAKFGFNEHFIHDAGAFQIGIGIGLLLAVIWRDALTVALAAFLLTNTLHAYNHAIDLDIGGRDSDPWLLGAVSVFVAAALVARLRQCGYVVGYVRAATTSKWVPFVEQKTVLVTTFRRDGTPVGTPVSLAVDGNRAFIRSFERAWKTRRLLNNPIIEVAPSTTRGRATGPAIHALARRLDGAESKRAARLLRRKYPFLQGALVPLSHRLGRAKTGKTVHVELTPGHEDAVSLP